MEEKEAGKRFFKLIDGTNIFGETLSVTLDNGAVEILIKQPYTAIEGNVSPYMMVDVGSAPGAVQIHPMNVLWSVPLDEFKELNEFYRDKTSPIVRPNSGIII